VIIALSYFIVFQVPPKQEDGTGGILVNYGTTDEGMGNDYMSTEEPSVAEKANHTKPTKVTKAPPTEQKQVEEASDKKIITQNTEDAPEVNSTSKKPTQTVATQPTTKAPPKPAINQNALYKGKSNNGTGYDTDDANILFQFGNFYLTNQGKPTGSTLTPNYNGTGSGNGGNLRGMPQRNFVTKPSVSDPDHRSGKVVVDVRVDKNGNFVYVHAGGRGTTLFDPSLFALCEQAVRNARVNALDTAPDVEMGAVVFVFKAQ
jgi:outer membrane biosynthesis protein TonB